MSRVKKRGRLVIGIERDTGFEDTQAQGKQFSHGCPNDSHLVFVLLVETRTKGLNDGIEALGINSRKIQCFSQMGVANLGQARARVDGGAGETMLWVQACIGSESACGRKGLNIFSQELGSGEFSNPGDTNQQVTLLLQARMLVDVSLDLFLQLRNLLVEEGKMLAEHFVNRGR